MKPIATLRAASPRRCSSLTESTPSKLARVLAPSTLRSVLTALVAPVLALTGARLPGLATEPPIYEQLMSFGTPAIPSSGSNPVAGLIQGTDGALYGTAVGGGTYEAGTVFKFKPDGTGFTVLHNSTLSLQKKKLDNQAIPAIASP